MSEKRVISFSAVGRKHGRRSGQLRENEEADRVKAKTKAEASSNEPEPASAPLRASAPGELVYAAVADEILDLKSAARLLGFSASHLSKILSGKFPDLPPLRHVRAGRTVRIRRGTLFEWFHQAENRDQDQ
jgi:hypothetical protein